MGWFVDVTGGKIVLIIFDGDWKIFRKICLYQNVVVQVFQTMNGVLVVFQVIPMNNDFG